MIEQNKLGVFDVSSRRVKMLQCGVSWWIILQPRVVGTIFLPFADLGVLVCGNRVMTVSPPGVIWKQGVNLHAITCCIGRNKSKFAIGEGGKFTTLPQKMIHIGLKFCQPKWATSHCLSFMWQVWSGRCSAQTIWVPRKPTHQAQCRCMLRAKFDGKANLQECFNAFLFLAPPAHLNPSAVCSKR